MAIVRPQRAAIEVLLAHSKHATLSKETVVTTAVRGRAGTFHLSSAGISNGDDCYHAFRDVPVVVFHWSGQAEAACISAGAACVLDEPVPGGAENERRVRLLLPVTRDNATVFRAGRKSVIYRQV